MIAHRMIAGSKNARTNPFFLVKIFFNEFFLGDVMKIFLLKNRGLSKIAPFLFANTNYSAAARKSFNSATTSSTVLDPSFNPAYFAWISPSASPNVFPRPSA